MDWAPTYPSIVAGAKRETPVVSLLFYVPVVESIKLEVEIASYAFYVSTHLPIVPKEVEYSPSLSRWGLSFIHRSCTPRMPVCFHSTRAFIFLEVKSCL